MISQRALAALTATLLVTGSACAQESDPSSAEALARAMLQMHERLEALEQDRAADRDEIRRLREQIADMDFPAAGSADPWTQGAPLTLGEGNLLNPNITVFGDLLGTLSTSPRNALNRFSAREFELDARAGITQWANGLLIIALEEEVEEEANGDIEIENNVVIEEGYVDFHTLPLDLALKVGKFRNAFGRHNPLHTHDLPQVDRPPVVQKFLGPEGIATVGASLSWLVPNPGDEYIELRTTVINADGGGETPLLGGPNTENPSFVGHLKWFTDLDDTTSLELGGSYLFSRTTDRAADVAHLFGVDLTVQWRDPDAADLTSLVFQTELFWADADVDADGTPLHSETFGGYAFAHYQFARDWYVGVRGDYTEDPLAPTADLWGASPYVSWYLSEFLRLRFQYQHNELRASGMREIEDSFFLNLTFAMGAHPPHPYWVNR